MSLNYLTYRGFTVVIPRIALEQGYYCGSTGDYRPAFFVEMVGFDSSVKAVSAALLERKPVMLKTAESGIDVSLPEVPFTRKMYHGGLLTHCILMPAVSSLSGYGVYLFGFDKNEFLAAIKEAVKRIPIPAPDDEEFFLALSQKIQEKFGSETYGDVIAASGSESDFEKTIKEFVAEWAKENLKGSSVEIKTLDDLTELFEDSLSEKVSKKYRPLYEVGKDKKLDLSEVYAFSGRKRIPAQEEVISAAAKAFKSGRKRLVICGEQGVGKTFITLALIATMPPQRTLIVCPPHLTKKWAREAREIVKGAKVVVLGQDALSKLDTLRDAPKNPDHHEVWVTGRERLKLSSRWKPALNMKVAFSNYKPVPVCPSCGAYQVNRYGEVLTSTKPFEKKKMFCQKCGQPLWQAVPVPRRWSPAEFIKRKLKKKFGLLVVDECHEYKAKDTAQATAVGSVMSACEKTIFLTGTLMGGYADDLFYLYYRSFPSYFQKEGLKWEDARIFLEKYGVLEEVISYNDDDDRDSDDNSCSRGRKKRKVTRKKPGISPEVVGKFLLPHTLFVRLSDLTDELPDYSEELVVVPRNPNEDGGEYEACVRAYERWKDEYRSQRAKLALASKFVQVLLNLPDCVRHLSNEIYGFENEWLHTTDVVDGPLLAKEEWLVNLVKSEKCANRKVLVYCTYTGEKDITCRLKKVLCDSGFRAEVLPSSVDTQKREEWIQKNAPLLDVLICNPKLVETGLDLYDFPTVVFYQPGYRIYTLRQAARRSWRIGQKKPVRVYFLAAQGTIQEDAWALIAEKWRTSLAVEGELIDDKSAFCSDSDSLLTELSKRLAQGKIGQTSAEAVFEQYKQQTKQAETTVDAPSVVEPRKIKVVVMPLRRKKRREEFVIPVSDLNAVVAKYGRVQMALF